VKRAKFRWTQGRLESICPARAFGTWLTTLADQNPSTVVEGAADRRSPAHGLFEWDDSTAAREHRLVQARILLGSFVIETYVTNKANKPRLINVPYVTRSGPGTYEVTATAMREDVKRDFILGEALRQAKHWRRRYASLSEFSLVYSALDEVESRVTRRKKR
jgi:hypothetical protein